MDGTGGGSSTLAHTLMLPVDRVQWLKSKARRDRFIEAELHAEEKHRQGMYCAMMVTLTEVLKLEVWDVDASN